MLILLHPGFWRLPASGLSSAVLPVHVPLKMRWPEVNMRLWPWSDSREWSWAALLLIPAVFWLMALMVTSPSLEAILLRELKASQRCFFHTLPQSLVVPSRVVAESSLSFTADSPTYPVQ